MNGINKIILIGNVGKEPETRTITTGNNEQLMCARFSLAVSEKTRDKNTNQITEKTEWFNIVVWRQLAQIVQQYVRKGAQIYIEGKINTRKYMDQNNVEKTITEVTANELQMLGRKEDNQNNAPASQYHNPATQQQIQQTQYNPYETSPVHQYNPYGAPLGYGTASTNQQPNPNPYAPPVTLPKEEDDLPF